MCEETEAQRGQRCACFPDHFLHPLEIAGLSLSVPAPGYRPV